jgi:hypothetical protein
MFFHNSIDSTVLPTSNTVVKLEPIVAAINVSGPHRSHKSAKQDRGINSLWKQKNDIT